MLLPSNDVASASNGPKRCLATVTSEEYTLKNYGYVYITKLNTPGACNSVIKTVKLLDEFIALFGPGPITPFQTISGQTSGASEDQGQLPVGIFILCWEPKEHNSMDGGHTAPDSLGAEAQPQARFLINENYLYQERLKGNVREIPLLAPVSLHFLC